MSDASSGQRLARLAVIIPALNEEQSLPLVLAALPPVGWVFVVDNGSADRTREVAARGGATVLDQPERGYGNACQVGIRAAVEAGAEVIAILDADFSDHPEELPLLADPVLEGRADMVLGDRTRKAEPGALLPHQRFGNALATLLIFAVTGHRYRDMGPFRAIRTSGLVAMQMRDPTWGWNVEMQIKAIRHGLRVLEVPVRYRKRRAGESKISGTIRGSIAAGIKIVTAVRTYA